MCIRRFPNYFRPPLGKKEKKLWIFCRKYLCIRFRVKKSVGEEKEFFEKDLHKRQVVQEASACF
jgi:hypothetical protein